MKFLKLLPTILKNLILITFDELKKLFQNHKSAKWILLAIIIIGIGYGGFRYYKNSTDPNNPNMSLSQAAKIGEVTTHKLMVEINGRNCPPEKSSGCYERGDIIVIHPADRDFSDGEKESALILKMDLTDKQAEILLHPEQKISKPKDIPEGMDPKKIPPMRETVKLRRYAVDLKKIGIAPDDYKGRVEDKIYKWDVVEEK